MRPERIEQSGVEMVGRAPPELSIIIPARDEEGLYRGYAARGPRQGTAHRPLA